ncbi:transcription initiation factor TFIID subunit 4-like [Hirundo rustica]|uniref:transcription initiation factor TFIID subunit 4-like n=1 Tax=Hirundo rustica TaxID=43150 RepID=UPI001A9401E7|nr:transcription initiation factor TFIID subunit 4-like [Hirundo rustica]
MHCQIPDREPKTKVFGPGQQRHRVPVPGSSPRCPRPGGGAARDDRAGQGDPGPPRRPPARSSEGTLPPQALPQPRPGPAGRGGSRTGPAVTVPGRAAPPRETPKVATGPEGWAGPEGLKGPCPRLREQRSSQRAPEPSAGNKWRRGPATLCPLPEPLGAKPRVPGYRAPGPPDRPGRSRRRAPVRPVPPSPPAPLSPATAADNKAAHEDVPRLWLGRLGPPRSSAHLRRGGTRRPAGPRRRSPLPAPRPAPDSPALRLHGALTLPVLGSPSSSSSSFAAPWRGRGARGPHRHRTRQAPQAHRARSPRGPAFPRGPHPSGRHILPRRDSTSPGAPMRPIRCPTSAGTTA